MAIGDFLLTKNKGKMIKKISLSKPNISKSDISTIINSLKSGWLTHGPNNNNFEKAFLTK